jgi:hypothetical protein
VTAVDVGWTFDQGVAGAKRYAKLDVAWATGSVLPSENRYVSR